VDMAMKGSVVDEGVGMVLIAFLLPLGLLAYFGIAPLYPAETMLVLHGLSVLFLVVSGASWVIARVDMPFGPSWSVLLVGVLGACACQVLIYGIEMTRTAGP
jgi:hypothetical protein